MASRKKESEGIALLSMYNDEDDEDMEEDDRPEDEQGGEEEDNEYRESNNNMEEYSRANDNTAPFPHQNSSPWQEQQQPSQSSDVEPSQLETKDNGVGETEGIEVEESVSVDNVDLLLDKFVPPAVAPKAKCSEDVQKKIDKFLYLKRCGKSFNAEVRNRKEYRNPDFLLHAVKVQEIDQIGSCFSKHIFDPHGYDMIDYYDEIEADMRHERGSKEQEGQKVDFVSVGNPLLISVPTAVDNIVRQKNKKSKWDTDAGAQDSLSTVGTGHTAKEAGHKILS
ncbi:HCNGP-like protein [Corchorus olitorius]|uniref:HCNGP-like protein n=1 Tax=Corchorus olitorius TaxID=93759 RepID=A0A1R3KNF6_9ROSI|nr:HCNGP-like protein [Corchorus olitorius]